MLKSVILLLLLITMHTTVLFPMEACLKLFSRRRGQASYHQVMEEEELLSSEETQQHVRELLNELQPSRETIISSSRIDDLIADERIEDLEIIFKSLFYCLCLYNPRVFVDGPCDQAVHELVCEQEYAIEFLLRRYPSCKQIMNQAMSMVIEGNPHIKKLLSDYIKKFREVNVNSPIMVREPHPLERFLLEIKPMSFWYYS